LFFILYSNPHSATELSIPTKIQSNVQSNEEKSDLNTYESFNDTLIWPLYEERHQKYMSFGTYVLHLVG